MTPAEALELGAVAEAVAKATAPRKRSRDLTERRLRAGELVLKTFSPEARHGAFWTWVDTGHLAAGSVCDRFERLGLLEATDGLFPGCGGQTYRHKLKRLEGC